MQMESKKLKDGFKRSVCTGLVLFVLVVMGSGCASTHKTTKTTTEVTSNEQQNNPDVQKSETTTTTTDTETKAEQRSILGSTLHAIGWVIALPFRLVGGLIGWIF
jgi:cytoskeletal protein RodZ